MKEGISDLKDFDKFLKTCRKHGVSEVSFQGISVKFGDLPSKIGAAEDIDEISTDAPTFEDLAFMAAPGQGIL